MSTDQEIFDAAFERHLREPEVTPDEHLWRMEITLGSAVMRRRRIFLDTNYWVMLCNHVSGKATNDDVRRLHAALIELVDGGKAICPTCVEVVGEVRKQSDNVTRTLTAELMTRLSESVVIQPVGRRVQREVLAFLSLGRRGGGCIPPLTKMVWTKPSRLHIGPSPPTGARLPHERCAAEKAVDDVLWTKTLLDAIRAGDDWPLDVPFAEMHDSFPAFVAEQMNEGRAELPASFPDFRKHFLEHLNVPLDKYAPVIEARFREFAPEAAPSLRGGRNGTPGIDAIRAAFQENRVGTALPYFRILPSLLTLYDRDRKRKYKSNDMLDYHIAAAALPYCDMYLTERPFRHLLTSEPLAFDRLYGTRVVSEPREAADAVEALASV